MALYEYEIGISQSTMVNLEDGLNIRPPRGFYYPASLEVETLDSGYMRWLGYPVAEWYFAQIKQYERDVLRNYCPGSSAVVYIKTRVNDLNIFKKYKAIMQWPREEERDVGPYRKDFKLRFILLQEVS